jgi:hypothetical protein
MLNGDSLWLDLIAVTVTTTKPPLLSRQMLKAATVLCISLMLATSIGASVIDLDAVNYSPSSLITGGFEATRRRTVHFVLPH